ncbi:hypothetical protein [Aquimonas sp.]|jgi:hypothetical protein|uniref:hypothetical protein n=1 Tax=Aquimonas sp. TaxID=1872588 RepID=UPI0037BF7B94
MSQTVHLWEHPEPKTLQSADRLHEWLSDRPAAPNPKWAHLRAAVEQRMVELDAAVEWAEGPIDPDHRERSYGLALSGDDVFDQTVIHCAISLGLSVYSDEAACLCLPFGYRLTFEGLQRIDWGDGSLSLPKLGPADREHVMERCEAAWRPRFEALGFEFSRGELWRNELPLCASRRVETGVQTIEISFSDYLDKLSFHVLAMIVPDLPTNLAEAAGGKQIQVRGRELHGMAAFMLHNGYEPLTIGGSLRRQDYVDRLIDALFEYLDDEILPTLDACSTAAGTIEVALEQNKTPAFLRPSGLTYALAAMQGKPVLEQVHQHYTRHAADWERGPVAYAALSALIDAQS